MAQRGGAATKRIGISPAKHVLSKSKGRKGAKVKTKSFRTWRFFLGASKSPSWRVTDDGKFAQAAKTFKHSSTRKHLINR